MKNPEILLEDILKIKKDFEEQDQTLPPGLAGVFGELLVFQKFQEKFKSSEYEIIFSSKQKRADIQIKKGKTEINIEVKTSRLKEEGYGLWYGVSLNIKSCKNKEHSERHTLHPKKGKVLGDFCYFDYVVFVALDDTFSAPKFYIIPRDFVEGNEKLLMNTHKRFSSGTHRLLLSDNGNMPKMEDEQLGLIRKTEEFRDRWDMIVI